MTFLSLVPFTWLADKALALHQRRRKVRVLVHRAYFQVPGSPPFYFVKVTNLSATREVWIEHVWFETEPRADLVNPQRPLPARLGLDETWEGWIETARVPDHPQIGRQCRVRLSTGKVVKSRWNRDVPPLGYVAGAGSG